MIIKTRNTVEQLQKLNWYVHSVNLKKIQRGFHYCRRKIMLRTLAVVIPNLFLETVCDFRTERSTRWRKVSKWPWAFMRTSSWQTEGLWKNARPGHSRLKKSNTGFQLIQMYNPYLVHWHQQIQYNQVHVIMLQLTFTDVKATAHPII